MVMGIMMAMVKELRVVVMMEVMILLVAMVRGKLVVTVNWRMMIVIRGW